MARLTLSVSLSHLIEIRDALYYDKHIYAEMQNMDVARQALWQRSVLKESAQSELRPFWFVSWRWAQPWLPVPGSPSAWSKKFIRKRLSRKFHQMLFNSNTRLLKRPFANISAGTRYCVQICHI